MLNLNKMAVGLLIASFAVFGAADAQPKRTVESAYEFLVPALTNGTKGALLNQKFMNSETETHTEPLVTAVQGNGCQMVVKLRGAHEYSIRIDWSRISDIANPSEMGFGSMVTLRGTVEDASGNAFAFFFPSHAIADRAVTAMQFIKDGCDPGKGTGF